MAKINLEMFASNDEHEYTEDTFSKAFPEGSFSVFSEEALSRFDSALSSSIKKAETSFATQDELDAIEKAVRDRSHLVKVFITRKDGRRTAKWVSPKEASGGKDNVGDTPNPLDGIKNKDHRRFVQVLMEGGVTLHSTPARGNKAVYKDGKFVMYISDKGISSLLKDEYISGSPRNPVVGPKLSSANKEVPKDASFKRGDMVSFNNHGKILTATVIGYNKAGGTVGSGGLVEVKPKDSTKMYYVDANKVTKDGAGGSIGKNEWDDSDEVAKKKNESLKDVNGKQLKVGDTVTIVGQSMSNAGKFMNGVVESGTLNGKVTVRASDGSLGDYEQSKVRLGGMKENGGGDDLIDYKKEAQKIYKELFSTGIQRTDDEINSMLKKMNEYHEKAIEQHRKKVDDSSAAEPPKAEKVKLSHTNNVTGSSHHTTLPEDLQKAIPKMLSSLAVSKSEKDNVKRVVSQTNKKEKYSEPIVLKINNVSFTIYSANGVYRVGSDGALSSGRSVTGILPDLMSDIEKFK